MAKKNLKKKVSKPTTSKQNKKKNDQAGEKVVIFKEGMNVADLANELKVSNAVIIKNLMQLGIMASINVSLDRDTVELVALEFGVTNKLEVNLSVGFAFGLPE